MNSTDSDKKKLAILVIHGMGNQDEGFSITMQNKLNKTIAKLGKNPKEIAWKEIFWAEILADRQEKYLKDAQKKGDIDYFKLRRFVVSALGDATAYRIPPKGKQGSTYSEIHSLIDNCIKELYDKKLKSPVPMIVLAHSLGGHIMSNYIWDKQQKAKQKKTGKQSFQDMEYLAGMITFGCNIPLFTFAYEDIDPIKLPGKGIGRAKLPQQLRGESKKLWHNFYDPDDVLGYPLQPLSVHNKGYDRLVKDIPINSGKFWASWNPLSHNGYWTDSDFTEPVSKFISHFL